MKKEDFNRYYKLLPKQGWLSQKESELIGLLSTCKDEEQKRLVFSLLEEFQYVNRELLPVYLNLIAEYIINESEFDINTCQVVGMTMDSNPDSSQWILQELKPILSRKGWNNVKITTNFNRAVSKVNKEGLNQLILVDEFIGSGQSIEGRIKYLKEHAKIEYQIKACFIAGMECGIDKVKNEFIEFKCFLPQLKAISDKLGGEEKLSAISDMVKLEKTLLSKINKKNLEKYSLGYNQVEALYSSYGNTPNSVFPIFWWPYDTKKNYRNPILVRNEEGFGL